MDFFEFFRWVLGTVVTIYATVTTAQSVYGWWIYFGGQGKYISLARRYLMLQGLRLRIKSFGGDVAVCVLLCVVWVLLLRAHHLVSRIDPFNHVDGRIESTTR